MSEYTNIASCLTNRGEEASNTWVLVILTQEKKYTYTDTDKRLKLKIKLPLLQVARLVSPFTTVFMGGAGLGEGLLWPSPLRLWLPPEEPTPLSGLLYAYNIKNTYRIVPSKRPWALAAHARKIMGGRLLGGAL